MMRVPKILTGHGEDGSARAAGRKPARRALLLAIAVWGLAGCATAPTPYRPKAPGAEAGRQEMNLAVFDEAWRRINRGYYDPAFHGVAWAEVAEKYRAEAVRARDEEELYRVLARMTGELGDRHVYPISPRAVHEGRQRHGVDFGFREREIGADRVVVRVVADSPAERAGVRVGWVLLAPDAGEVAAAQRSAQPVAFSFRDEIGATRSVALTPALLAFDSLRPEARLIGDRALYLRFDYFDATLTSWLSRELKKHRERAMVILDLRDNVGGDSVALRQIAREFFAEGKSLGRTIDRAGRAREMPTLAVFPARYAGKVAVLIGGQTTSSAEILAHVLQVHRRATLVGRRTAGVVVEGFRRALPDGGYINVAEQDYRGVDGRRLEGAGVEPDVSVTAPTLADLRGGRDRDLAAALRLMD